MCVRTCIKTSHLTAGKAVQTSSSKASVSSIRPVLVQPVSSPVVVCLVQRDYGPYLSGSTPCNDQTRSATCTTYSKACQSSHMSPNIANNAKDRHDCCALLQEAIGSCNSAFMFVTGAPAGGYCAATCSRCPLGTSPAAAAPSPSVTTAAASAPEPVPAAAACVDTPPNDAFTCAELVSTWLSNGLFAHAVAVTVTVTVTVSSAVPVTVTITVVVTAAARHNVDCSHKAMAQ